MTRGRFITLDGSEAVGKTTQLEHIRQWLLSRNIPHYFTREPGGTAFGEQIRSLLLNPATTLDAYSELLLMLAARNEHIHQAIRPRLARGEWVISDRYNDATYAYQGGGRHIPFTAIATIERQLPAYLEPDLRLILMLDDTEARKRFTLRGNRADRFEQENADFFNSVNHAYRQRAQADNARLITADDSPENVFARIAPHLERLYLDAQDKT